ncbi:unnamed protein product, partial [Didymodactylos carnosus]
KKIYCDVIDDVITTVREALLDEGFDEHTLSELRQLWFNRLDGSKALEPLPLAEDANQRIHGGHKHSSRGYAATTIKHDSTLTTNSSAPGITHQYVKQVQPTGASNLISSHLNPTNSSATFHTASMTSLQHLPPAHLPPSLLQNFPGSSVIFPQNAAAHAMQNASFQQSQQMFKQNRGGANNVPQIDGQCDELITKPFKQKQAKKEKKEIQVCFQLDGTVPPISDDDEDDDNEEEPLDQVEDEEDETNEEGNEDPKPLCSEDDVSDDEASEMFECDNVVVCQYDKVRLFLIDL